MISINRVWAMPNKNTFEISPVRKLIERYFTTSVWIDPFANTCDIADYTNDIDPKMPTGYHLEAIDFLNKFPDDSINGVLFDPPYTQRQLSEVYHRFNLSVNMQTTQTSYWSNLKNEIARIVVPGGYVISAGWNTNGVSKKRGFTLLEILIIAHGSQHNDTLITVERKMQERL